MNITVTEFQVLESFDPTQNKIWKVELQYRQVLKTSMGSTVYTGPWESVTRVRTNVTEMKTL